MSGGGLHRAWGENIKDARIAQGMSVIVFADAMSVSAATVSRWESGKQVPRDHVKIEIAEVLGVEARSLFPLEMAS